MLMTAEKVVKRHNEVRGAIGLVYMKVICEPYANDTCGIPSLVADPLQEGFVVT